MSGSDKIKSALVGAYPDTSATDWKRRSKKKVDGLEHREFENTQTGWRVTVIEELDGSFAFGDTPSGQPSPLSAQPTLAEKVTQTGQKLVRELAAAAGLTGEEDIDGVVPTKAKPKVDETPLEPGDKMQIPAGTRVFELSYSGSAEGGSVAKRATTATFVGTTQITNWLTIAPEDNIAEIEALMSKAAGGRDQTGSSKYLLDWIKEENRTIGTPFARSGVQYSRSADIGAALMKAQQAVRDEFGEKPIFAVWGSGSSQKAAFFPKVIKLSSKAETTPKKEAKITKRRLMVEGSTWRFTRDVEIDMWVDNPKINELIAKRDSLSRSGNSQHRRGGTIVVVLGGGVPNTADEKQQITSIQNEINRLCRDEKQVRIKAGSISAGTVIQIMDKLSPGYSSWGAKETNGLIVPCVTTSGTITGSALDRTFYLPVKKGEDWRSNSLQGYELPFKQIEDAVEADHVPETIVYVLRDNATGAFLGGWDDKNRPKMSKTFSGAKKYKNSSAVKASIRDFTGYNSGINDDGESADAYWAVGGDKKIDLPATWEIVAIDKTTNAEKEVIEVQEWFKNLMRLRVLTQKHCSAVRTAYKKAEESDHTFEAILLFQNRDKGSVTYQNGNSSSWDQAEPFHHERDGGAGILAAIKSAADQMSQKTLRVKTQSAVAYACSLEDGVAAKMMFNYPGAIVRLLDINNLEDVVEDGADIAKPVTREYVINGKTTTY